VWFRSLFDSLKSRSSSTPARRATRNPARRRASAFRPQVEALDDRCLPSTFTVTNLLDAGAGSGLAGDLRYCVSHATSGNDTIAFGVTGTIDLESALPTLNASVAIQGPGASQLTVERDAPFASNFGIFSVGSAASVAISALTLTGGTMGAVINSGALTISDCVLSGNYNYTGDYNYNFLSYGGGGAISNSGALTISRSTISYNQTYAGGGGDGAGGAIFMIGGTLAIDSSTLYDNYAQGGNGDLGSPDAPGGPSPGWPAGNAFGGAVYIGAGVASIDHSTIADNAVVGGVMFLYSGGEGISGLGSGGGIYNAGSLQMHDTIVAGNVTYSGQGLSGAPDLDGNVASLGHNLVGNSAGGSGYAASDLLDVDPQLGPLQDTGGPTPTMALLAGSPAINAGDDTDAPAYDQRGLGFPRIVGGAIDIGAFEFQMAVAPQVSRFTVAGFPSPITTGAAGVFTATAQNADGTTATGYTGTIHFTSSDLQAVLPADYTFTAADYGVHMFSATLKTAGSQSITTRDTVVAGAAGTQAGIVVNPVSVTVAGFPASVTAGAADSFTVTALDGAGNTLADYAGTVHFTSSDPQAVLPADYTFTEADHGVHTFSATLKTAGSQSITVSDALVPGVLSGTQSGITVTPAAMSRVTVAGFPSSVTAGVAGYFTVTASDAYGNRATYTGTVRFTSSDAKAVLPGNYTFTAADAGMHTFSATLKTAVAQSLTATDTVNAAITGGQGSILVNPAAASRLVLSAPASVSANAQFSLTVTVVDAYGNVVTGYRGTLSFSSTDATATLPKKYTFTAADQGTHTFTGLRLKKKGKQTITVTDMQNSSLIGSAIIDFL
jgi:hypothetical protein